MREKERGRVSSSEDRCSRGWSRLATTPSIRQADQSKHTVDHPRCCETLVDSHLLSPFLTRSYLARCIYKYTTSTRALFISRLVSVLSLARIAWRQSRRHFRGACQDATSDYIEICRQTAMDEWIRSSTRILSKSRITLENGVRILVAASVNLVRKVTSESLKFTEQETQHHGVG